MKKNFAAIFLTMTFFVFSALTVGAQPVDKVEQKLDDAWTAYNIGQYQKVLQLVQPLASDGNARAQIILGRCYENGLGVPQDMEMPPSGSVSRRNRTTAKPRCFWPTSTNWALACPETTRPWWTL